MSDTSFWVLNLSANRFGAAFEESMRTSGDLEKSTFFEIVLNISKIIFNEFWRVLFADTLAIWLPKHVRNGLVREFPNNLCLSLFKRQKSFEPCSLFQSKFGSFNFVSGSKLMWSLCIQSIFALRL